MANPWFSAFKPEELTEIADRTGKKLIYFEYDGILFPPFPGIDKRLSALPSFLEEMTIYAHQDFVKRKCKDCVLIRNPKDAYVSFFNHTRSIKPYYSYDGEWSDYFELAIQGKTETNLWFDYVDAWDKFFKDHPELPVLTLYYEESKQDLLTTVKKLSSFIGVNLTEDVSKEIALACSFSQMKTAKVKAYPKEHLFIWDKGEYTMYRKGVAGDWKNYFTVAQNERFNALYKERMKNSKHYNRYLDQ
ncbi:LOW QUALITY PROTEIN: sulfotransferase 1C2A-like [Liolophura sinensis]|uniref:LOW QUALITY PROTEIN: sulfotransferase 1C2A-like n=1 Tax=Liolophura sinensis TaxID=3198878 RepID=UPI003157F897